MIPLLVVDSPEAFPFSAEGVEVVSAREYLRSGATPGSRGRRVYNLCRSYRYQSVGYYVSLLAEARGHRPIPAVSTIEDFKSREIVRVRSDALDDLVQKSLAPVKAERFDLSVYFGRNLAERHQRLASELYKLFPAPLVRASFARNPRDGHWELRSVGPIAAGDVPEAHREFVLEAARAHFARRASRKGKGENRWDLAILHDPAEAQPPSNARAMRKFQQAAVASGFTPYLVTRDDYSTIAEYDALFIRETTHVRHHTYRFARRAMSAGLAVIDDPESIVRCSNKVFLAELLERSGISTPRTRVIHRDNREAAARELGYPCVVKTPDGAFSRGVFKVDDPATLIAKTDLLFEKSELLLIQEWMPTPFDWRIGLLDGKPLYACQYFMARRHWQIVQTTAGGKQVSGAHRTLPVGEVPRFVLDTAIAAGARIGDGLYGVDLKEVKGKAFVIEVNDNPSIDAGCEDQVLGEELYLAIMASLRRRMDRRR
ncbi:MAG: RimK family protein [Myxococcales bacterium]|nr:RimK family protein [Myxococcales bacterium]